MSQSPHLGLTYLVEGQSGGETVYNGVLNRLDVFTQPYVISRTTTAAPVSPAAGDRYILPASPTGAWAGNGGKVAMYFNGWIYATPQEGWKFWVRDENKTYVYDGAAWVEDLPTALALSSNSYVVLGTSANLSNERVLTAGTGITFSDAGAGGNLTVSLSSPVAITNGGTGQTSANAALNALLPSQATHANKFLRTDGTNTSWVTSGSTPAGSNREIQFNNSGVFAGAALFVYDLSSVSLGVGTTTPDSSAHLRPPASSNIPALHLDQSNASQDDDPFVKFTGTSAADKTKSVSSQTTSWTLDGYIRVTINGTTKYIPFYS